MTFPSLYRICF